MKYANSLVQLMVYVAAWMKWDLEALESGLPFLAQQVLMNALIRHSAGLPYAPLCNMERELSTLTVSEAAAAVTHARWVVRAFVHQNGVPLRPAKPNYVEVAPSPLQIPVEEANEILSQLLPQATACLRQVPGLRHALQFAPAQVKGCDDITTDLSPPADLECQVGFELAQLFFLRGDADQAARLFRHTAELLPNVDRSKKTCTLTEEGLHGFLIACQLPRNSSLGTPLQVLLDRVDSCRKEKFKV